MAMPDDDSKSARTGTTTDQNARAGGQQRRSFFEIPTPLKRVFDKFPLVAYNANELPQRALRDRTQSTLHVFTTDEDANHGRPSYNPGCLKWQTYLKFCNISFRTEASSNHASPSGVLPYLQPAVEESGLAPDPIPSNKLKKWLATEKNIKSKESELEEQDERYDGYIAMIDAQIRKAWLFQLYLAPQNSDVVDKLYLGPCSAQPLVRMAIGAQLRTAAETELVKSCKVSTVSVTDLLHDVDQAFQALSTLLGDQEWFFTQNPGLFDASLFAYTHLILNGGIHWNYNPLGESLRKYDNIVQHSKRISKLYY